LKRTPRNEGFSRTEFLRVNQQVVRRLCVGGGEEGSESIDKSVPGPFGFLCIGSLVLARVARGRATAGMVSGQGRIRVIRRGQVIEVI
jgi:hypothetical protein